MDANDADRLAHLEREMAILRAEFAKLREHVRAPGVPRPAESPPPRPAMASDAPPLPPRPSTPPPSAKSVPPPRSPSFEYVPRKSPSAEQLIGRYGTIAVATITVLVGVGVLLKWAIDNGYLGKEVRVALGYLVAAGFAYGGIRLRLRGTREFGNVLLAIALGVVHLVCWSAGPLLHVLPSSVALAIGFLASVVLAEFALRHDEEGLCAIGFGGAAIAPFITSDGSENVIALAIYGLIVVALSAAALRDRPWKAAVGVTIVSFVVYVVVLATTHPANTSWPGIVNRLGLLFPIAVLLAFIPLVHARHRRGLIRVATGAVALGGMTRGTRGEDLWSLSLIIAATVIAIGALDVFGADAIEREDAADADLLAPKRFAFLDALGLPMVLFVAAIVATPGATSTESAIVGVVWSVLAVFMTHRNRAQTEGDMYATTAALTALWIVPAAIPDGHDLARTIGAVVVGLILLGLTLRIPRPPLAWGGIASLVIASLFAVSVLENRPPFTYDPFTNWASITTIVAIGGWLAARRIIQYPGFLPELKQETRRLVDSIVVTGAAGTAFLWGRGELAGAWNVTASTALLIVYYAATGALMIWQGRARRVKSLRIVGLILTVMAAGKALIEAFEVPNVAVRMAIFFAVSAFLLAVGYWYRKDAPDAPDAPLEAAA